MQLSFGLELQLDETSEDEITLQTNGETVALSERTITLLEAAAKNGIHYSYVQGGSNSEGLEMLLSNGDKVLFSFNLKNSILLNNLILVDTDLSKILAWLVLYAQSTTLNNLKTLLEVIALQNPLCYNEQMLGFIYERKVTNFLSVLIRFPDFASKVYTGDYQKVSFGKRNKLALEINEVGEMITNESFLLENCLIQTQAV